MPDAPSTKRQFLVAVEGIDGYWAMKSGGETTSATKKVYDGGTLRPDTLAEPGLTGDVSISRPFRVSRDQPLLDRLTPLVGRWRTTVSTQPTDADLVPIGRPTVYADSLLSGVTPPDVDASSGEEARIELTFGVS